MVAGASEQTGNTAGKSSTDRKEYQSVGILMDRFKKIYQQGTIDVVEIWVDTETGVNYVFHRNGNAAGFTPLLDKDGKPVVSK